MPDETISGIQFPTPLIVGKTFTIENVEDQLFHAHDIMHAWPKSLKNPAEYQLIASLFDPTVFWKWANPWDVTICVHRETHRCEYLLPEHQCLFLKQYVEDTYGVTLPSMPSSFNTELWTGKWDLTLKQVNSEPEFRVYVRLAKTAVRSAKTALKLERAAHTRNRQLEMAKEKFSEAMVSGGKFVSIDVECYELDHNCTTELGISTLMFPGDGEVKSRHLLIREYAHLRNSKFVPDMADAFDFGKSELVHLKDCGKFMIDAFRSDDGVPVYFIGHDPMADIKYLERNLNCDFPKGMNVFDTRLMFSAFGGDSVLRNLAHCLNALNIEYWNLHNAGNDAHYTLVSFKKMCTAVSTAAAVVTAKVPQMSIRDIVPDDLIIKPVEQKPSSLNAKAGGKRSPSRLPNSDSVESNDNECVYPNIATEENEPLRKCSVDSFTNSGAQDIPWERPDADTHLNPHGGENEYVVLAADQGSPRHVPPQKRNFHDGVKPSSPSLLDTEFPPLLASTTSHTISHCCQKELEWENGSSKGCQASSTIEMGTVKHGSAVDELTAAFGIATIKV